MASLIRGILPGVILMAVVLAGSFLFLGNVSMTSFLTATSPKEIQANTQMQNVPACNSDSDCGQSQFMTANYCGADGNLYRDYDNQNCLNPGTPSAKCQESVTQILQQQCPNGCSLGFCN
ncbi:MAG: hypothetical protein EPN86_04080 [Nanoarchaeota archaeon]|nr:MAG: hypothetical protein EPN86_04080 [Nanoarchaeota archaeon]